MTISAQCERSINQTLKSLAAGNIDVLDEAMFTSKAEKKLFNHLQMVNDLVEEIIIHNENIALGNIESCDTPIRKGRIGSSINGVNETINRVANQANAIAAGDFSIDIFPQGNRDQLGLAFFDMTKTLREVSKICRSIALGDLSKKVVIKGEKDNLARSVNEMIDNFSEIVTQADDISQGDYSVKIRVKSDKDLLSKALVEMMNQLTLAKYNNEKERWLKSGLAELLEKMRGKLEPLELAKKIITHLCKFFGAQVGVLYLVDNNDKLNLAGSYAHSRRKKMNTTLDLGEGLAGQAGLEKEIILVRDIETDYISVNSALGEQAPKNLIVSPFMVEGNLKGVIEIGAVNEISDSVIDLLKLASESIAIAFHSSQDRARTNSLLDETRKQAELLQDQQIEMSRKNNELTEQTKSLTESEDLLRDQSEQLRNYNEALQEKTEALAKQKNAVILQNEIVAKAKVELEKQTQELQLVSQYKSEFLANMSHELRTPLNSLLILADSLSKNKEGNLTTKQIEKANIIHDGGKDLLTLINDILDLSKVEAGKLDVTLEKIEISSFLANIKRHFSPTSQQKGIDIIVKIDPGSPTTIRTDSQRIQQILRNLASNALKFTEHGSITIRAHLPPSGVELNNPQLTLDSTLAISVIDTGIGIPENKQRDIFEAFQQADGSTSRKFGGTGLGLTISRELATLLGGEISLKSEEGKGSTFTLYLPLCGQETYGSTNIIEPVLALQPVPIEPVSPELVPIELSISKTDIDKNPDFTDQQSTEALTIDSHVANNSSMVTEDDRSVLIIEDDPYFAKTLVEFSHEQGFTCLTANDGQQGLLQATTHSPNAIILDIDLPELDGLSVLDSLKDNLSTRHIPIHMISALDEQISSLQKGAIGYFQKPVTEDNLVQVFHKFENILNTSIRNLLLIENDISAQQAISDLLMSPELTITSVTSGEQAHEKINTNTYDCIILDYDLDDMSGMDLLVQLHNDNNLELPPVIIYTGKHLNDSELFELKKYARRIILKGSDSSETLLDDVSLFLHSVEEKLPKKQQKIIRKLHDPDAMLKDKVILVVDDDMRNTYALTASLEEIGCKILVASNGKLALESIEANPEIDLVIMDIMMPVMDGYEATRALRENPRHNKLPVIALTALAMTQDHINCLEAGASDYLTKPVDMEQLTSMMRVWLSK